MSARFADVGAVRSFLTKLGMPKSLVEQLNEWLRELAPEQAEEMEPELMWEGRPARLRMRAAEEEGAVVVEFSGPVSLIEALQADLDEFFEAKGKKK